MRLHAFGDVVFADHGYSADFPADADEGLWSILPTIIPTANSQSVLTGGALTERTIPIEFGYDGDETFEQAFKRLLGLVQPSVTTPRQLVAELNDGQQIECQAIVSLPGQSTVDADINMLEVVFTSVDPVWRKVVPESRTQAQARGAAGITVPVVNTGHAPANLVVTIAGTSTGGTASDSKLAFRRTFTVALAATATDPLVNQWVRVPLGDTTGWVATGKALADGSNVYVFSADGQEVRRELINFNDTVSHLGVVITDLAPGITREYVIAYGDALATAPLDFSSDIKAKRAAPVFDTSFDRRTVSSVTTNVITVAGTPYRINQFRRGKLEMLTGAAVGLTKDIVSNTANTITLPSAFSPQVSSGDAFLITMSETAKYIYPVSLDERNDFKRGLWWINRGQNKPSQRRHDPPGAWWPIRTLDNNDDTAQMIWSKVNVGTDDYFSILDVQYSWDGGGPFTGEYEIANGIQYDSPIPITAWRFGYSRHLPNGMCHAIFAMREAGASDWEPVVTDTTHDVVGAALVDVEASADTSTVPVEGTTKHLAAFLIPENLTEIPLDWIRDTGTATSGSATQLGDNTKAWASDQFNGGRIRFLSGAGAPQNKIVSDGSPNTINPTVNFSPVPSTDTRYQVTNKKLVAQLRSRAPWVLFFDASDITISAVSAETDNYRIAATLRLDGGSNAVPPYQRARIGLDERHVMFGTGQALRFDGERRAIEIVTADTEALVRRLTEPAVIVQDVDAANVAVRAGDWLAVTPGTHTLFAEWDAGANAPIGADVTVSWSEGVFA